MRYTRALLVAVWLVLSGRWRAAASAAVVAAILFLLVFPGAMLGSEAVAILATLLYCAAAGWHRALELGGAGAASAAAAAGTCALGAVWIQALWRLCRRPGREDPGLH